MESDFKCSIDDITKHHDEAVRLVGMAKECQKKLDTKIIGVTSINVTTSQFGGSEEWGIFDSSFAGLQAPIVALLNSHLENKRKLFLAEADRERTIYYNMCTEHNLEPNLISLDLQLNG